MEEYNEFWKKYYKTTSALKKKYLFRSIPFNEAKEQYTILYNESKRKLPDYQAQCALALARCEENKTNEENESKKLSILLHDKEKSRRRTEFARHFFQSEYPTTILLHATYSISSPPIDKISFTNNSQFILSTFPSIPVHQFLPISQIPTAIQSYLISIYTFEESNKVNMAASLRYELAIQLQRIGDISGAALLWESLIDELLLQRIQLPSKKQTSSPKIIIKSVKQKIASRSPITACCALERSLDANIHSLQYKKATKNALKLIDILIEEKSTIPAYIDKLVDIHITLLLLYTLKRDYPKAHKILHKLSNNFDEKQNNSLWEIALDYTSDINIFLYDLIMSYEEGDMDCVIEIAKELFPLLSCIQQEILLLLMEQ